MSERLWVCSKCETVKASARRPRRCQACGNGPANYRSGPQTFTEVRTDEM